jgi:chitinase
MEIYNRGIPLNKIVVGKPVTVPDASNTGWVDKSNLVNYFNQGYSKYGWYAGLMVWQFPSDSDQTFVSTVTTDLINACKSASKCV